MGRKKKTYSLDFKKKCIGQLLDGKAFAQVCTDNCIAPSTLSPWKKSVLEGMGSGSKSRQEAKENEALRKELEMAQKLLSKKEMANELLKKARLL